jgi:hypothetical protein
MQGEFGIEQHYPTETCFTPVLLPAFYKKQLFTKTIVQENKPLNNIR